MTKQKESFWVTGWEEDLQQVRWSLDPGGGGEVGRWTKTQAGGDGEVEGCSSWSERRRMQRINEFKKLGWALIGARRKLVRMRLEPVMRQLGWIGDYYFEYFYSILEYINKGYFKYFVFYQRGCIYFSRQLWHLILTAEWEEGLHLQNISPPAGRNVAHHSTGEDQEFSPFSRPRLPSLWKMSPSVACVLCFNPRRGDWQAHYCKASKADAEENLRRWKRWRI